MDLNVTWSAATDTGGSALKGYIVYRGGVFVRQVLAPATSTSDTGLAPSAVYSYTVRAFDNAGNFSGLSNTATGNTPGCNERPRARAGANQSAMVGTPVTFDGWASYDPDGTIVSYGWTFGDGTSGSGVLVTHAYASAGTYTVTLTVTDNLGVQSSDAAIVTIGGSTSASRVVWRQAHGGASSTIASALVTDGAGNVVVVGTFYGSTDLGVGGTLTSAGVGDIFVAKYAANGTPLWARRFGGAGNDRGYGLAIDRRANCDAAGGTDCIVITGAIEGAADLGGGHVLTSVGLGDIVIAKYSAAGTPLWATRFGDAQDDLGYGVTVDPSGNVLATGFFTRQTDFGGGMLYSPYRDQDTFVVKLTPTGGYLWARNFWNTSLDVGRGIGTDASGNVVVAGYYMGSLDVGTGARLNRGQEDAFVAKLAATDGHGLWLKGFGAAGAVNLAYGVAVDGAGDVVTTGAFSGNVDFGSGAFAAAGTDVFVAKVAGGTGAALWGRRCTGTYTNAKRAAAIAVDTANNVVVTGLFQGTLDCGAGPVTGAASGVSDAFAAKFTSAGDALWSVGYGATGTDAGYGIAADTDTDEVLVTGSFQGSVDFAGGTLRSTGSDTLFLLKLAP